MQCNACNPLSAEKQESKITSTLRRLSVVRRKSKNKMRVNKADAAKGIEEEKAEGSPPAAAAASAASEAAARPSSTTSRDSENDVVTSGYFRLTTRIRLL